MAHSFVCTTHCARPDCSSLWEVRQKNCLTMLNQLGKELVNVHAVVSWYKWSREHSHVPPWSYHSQSFNGGCGPFTNYWSPQLSLHRHLNLIQHAKSAQLRDEPGVNGFCWSPITDTRTQAHMDYLFFTQVGVSVAVNLLKFVVHSFLYWRKAQVITPTKLVCNVL